MKASPPASAPAVAGDAARAVDRELRRGRPGQQLAGGEGVLELARAAASARRSTTTSRSSATCAGGPPKPISADPPPLAQHRHERDLRHGARPY